MSRIVSFYVSSYEKLLGKAKVDLQSRYGDGNIDFVDFCIDEPVVSDGAIDVAKTADAVWYFAPHFQSATAPLSVIRNRLGLFAGVNAIVDENGQSAFFVCDESGFPQGDFSSSNAFGRQARDTKTLSELEIEKTLRIAFELAEMNATDLTLVLPVEPTAIASLWRKIVFDIAEDYPFVRAEVENSVEATVRISSSQSAGVCVGMREQCLPLCTLSSCLKCRPIASMSLGETTLGAYECLSKDESVASALVENTLAYSFGIAE